MTNRAALISSARPSSMRGMSVLGWMLTISLVVVLGSAAIRIVPAFLEYNTVRSVINSALSDPELHLQSEREVRSRIRRNFDINNVRSISADEVVIVKEGRRVRAGVAYEVRDPLIANIDLVISFEREFEKDISR